MKWIIEVFNWEDAFCDVNATEWLIDLIGDPSKLGPGIIDNTLRPSKGAQSAVLGNIVIDFVSALESHFAELAVAAHYLNGYQESARKEPQQNGDESWRSLLTSSRSQVSLIGSIRWTFAQRVYTSRIVDLLGPALGLQDETAINAHLYAETEKHPIGITLITAISSLVDDISAPTFLADVSAIRAIDERVGEFLNLHSDLDRIDFFAPEFSE